jgi:uncharacterized membrane protein YeaQ/YmgE (transglycosylase-associated protein family)
MDTFTWMIVGVIAGVLASMVVGGSGYGIIGDVVAGAVGALAGGLIFQAAGWRTPFEGMLGVIFVAFIGAMLCLLVLRGIARLRTSVTRQR